MKAQGLGTDPSVQEFRSAVTEWWQMNKRRFPWRERREFFGTLIAEVLLRKTTAAQVAAVYPILLEKWPDPCALSRADEGEIEATIRPLGMQKTRTSLLKRLSQVLCERFGPNPNPSPDVLTPEALKGMPGLGPYAINMTLATVKGEPLPGLDRNFIRVIERFFGLESRRKRPHTDRLLWRFAEELIPKERSAEFNWAVLDFASLVCRPRPLCGQCPLRHMCKNPPKKS